MLCVYERICAFVKVVCKSEWERESFVCLCMRECTYAVRICLSTCGGVERPLQSKELRLSYGWQWLACTAYGTYGGERRTYHSVALKRQCGSIGREETHTPTLLTPIHGVPELCFVPWLAILYRLFSKV